MEINKENNFRDTRTHDLSKLIIIYKFGVQINEFNPVTQI